MHGSSIREQIDRRRFLRPMKEALRRVLCGETYREAAAAEGVDQGIVHLTNPEEAEGGGKNNS